MVYRLGPGRCLPFAQSTTFCLRVMASRLCRHAKGGAQEFRHEAKPRAEVVNITDEMTLRDLSRMLHLSSTDLEARLAMLGEVTESVEDMCAPARSADFDMVECCHVPLLQCDTNNESMQP